jgi:hypothetical protein
VNPILAGVALAVVVGAVAAVAARDARIAVLGLTIALVLSPLLAEPAPTPLGLAARFIGAVLAGYLLGIVVRDRSDRAGGSAATGGSRIGWPAELLVAAGALVVGFAAHGLGAPADGPAIGSAAGFAMAALAVTPLLTGQDTMRIGIGALLLVGSGLVVRSALGGTPGDFEQLMASGMLVVVAGVLAAVAGNARADGSEGFAVRADEEPRRRGLARGHGLGQRTRRHREPDAHPIDAR